jgi:beta-lactamase superfamily II metal-dependent hydrolase
VYVPPRLGADAFAEHLRQVAAQRGAAWRTWHAGVTQQIGALALVISHPPAVVSNFAATGATASDNMWSLVVRAECDGRSVLFTGDATAGAEALQIAAGRLAPADVLKVAHHGSRSSTSARLLDAVEPALGVISVGGNHMGLPAPAVLKRLARHNVRVVRTDVSGALELTFHTNEITVRAFAPSDGAYR